MEFIALIRDLAIILLALLAIVQITLLLLVTIVLWKAVKPLTQTAQSTLKNVEATTHMMADTAVHPIIRLAGMAAGAKAMVAVLTKRGKR